VSRMEPDPADVILPQGYIAGAPQPLVKRLQIHANRNEEDDLSVSVRLKEPCKYHQPYKGKEEIRDRVEGMKKRKACQEPDKHLHYVQASWTETSSQRNLILAVELRGRITISCACS